MSAAVVVVALQQARQTQSIFCFQLRDNSHRCGRSGTSARRRRRHSGTTTRLRDEQVHSCPKFQTVCTAAGVQKIEGGAAAAIAARSGSRSKIRIGIILWKLLVCNVTNLTAAGVQESEGGAATAVSALGQARQEGLCRRARQHDSPQDACVAG